MITIAWPLGEVLLATVVAMEFSPRAIGPDAAIESCLPGWEVPPRDGTNSARMVTLGVPAEPKEKAEKAPKEPKAPKAEKAPKAKADPKPKGKAKAASPTVEVKKEEEDEYEDEEIEYEGVKYMLRGVIVYDIEDGTIKGRLTEEGDVELA